MTLKQYEADNTIERDKIKLGGNTLVTRVGPGDRDQTLAIIFFIIQYSFKLGQNMRALGILKWLKSNGWKKKEKKTVKTLGNYACNRHHRWRTQAAWTNSFC